MKRVPMSVVEKAIAGILSLLFNSLVVMLLWNAYVAPELAITELSYGLALVLVMIFRFASPPRFDE